MEQKYIFKAVIGDATAFKKCIDMFKKLLAPIPFRVTREGLMIDLSTSNIYDKARFERSNLISFYFDHNLANHPEFVEDGKAQPCHAFTLDLSSVKSTITSITKKDHICICQYESEPEIHVNIHRDGYAEKHSTKIFPINTTITHYSSSQFHRDINNPSCVVSSSSLGEFLKKIYKNQITNCPIECYPEGLTFNGSSNARHIKSDFTIGEIGKKPLYTRYINKSIIQALKEMCSITPSGIMKFYMEFGFDKILRIHTPITYLGSMTLFILPAEDELEDEPGEEKVEVEALSDEEYEEDD